MNLRRTLQTSVGLAAAFSWLMACQTETIPPAGLWVQMRTDMAVPEPIKLVGIYIERVDANGTKRVILSREVTAQLATKAECEAEGLPENCNKVRLPAELAIQSDRADGSRVRVRLVAYGPQDDSEASPMVPLAMREARVSVPTKEIKAVKMALLWLNTDDVADRQPEASGPIVNQSRGLDTTSLNLLATDENPSQVDAFSRFLSDYCGEDKTLDDQGECVSIDVEPDEYIPWATRTQPGVIERGQTGAEAPGANDDLDGGVGPLSCPDTSPKRSPFCEKDAETRCFNLQACVDSAFGDEANYRPTIYRPDSIQRQADGRCFIDLARDINVNAMRDSGQLNPKTVAILAKQAKQAGAVCLRDAQGNERPDACYTPIELESNQLVDRSKLYLPAGLCRKAELAQRSLSSGSEQERRRRWFELVATPLCRPAHHIDNPLCVADSAQDPNGAPADRGQATATGAQCVFDGSGWSREEPSEEPATVPPSCALVGDPRDRALSFWVSAKSATVITEGGTLFELPLHDDSSLACVVSCGGAVGSPDNWSGGVPGRYRLHGDDQGARWVLGLDASDPSGVVALPKEGSRTRTVRSSAVIGGGLDVDGRSVFLSSDGRGWLGLQQAELGEFSTKTQVQGQITTNGIALGEGWLQGFGLTATSGELLALQATDNRIAQMARQVIVLSEGAPRFLLRDLVNAQRIFALTENPTQHACLYDIDLEATMAFSNGCAELHDATEQPIQALEVERLATYLVDSPERPHTVIYGASGSQIFGWHLFEGYPSPFSLVDEAMRVSGTIVDLQTVDSRLYLLVQGEDGLSSITWREIASDGALRLPGQP